MLIPYQWSFRYHFPGICQNYCRLHKYINIFTLFCWVWCCQFGCSTSQSIWAKCMSIFFINRIKLIMSETLIYCVFIVGCCMLNAMANGEQTQQETQTIFINDKFELIFLYFLLLSLIYVECLLHTYRA